MGLSQTFDLIGCRSLLAKLRWELDQIHADNSSDPLTLAYRGYNAAVAAWHLADWVWEDMTEDQKDALGVTSKGDLQEKARAFRPLYHCRHIATASKHFVVDSYPDPQIQAYVSASPRLTMFESEYKIERAWSLKIMDGQQRVSAVEQFERAYEWWADLIHSNGIDRIVSKASPSRFGW